MTGFETTSGGGRGVGIPNLVKPIEDKQINISPLPLHGLTLSHNRITNHALQDPQDKSPL